MSTTVSEALTALREAVRAGELARLCGVQHVELVTLFGSAVDGAAAPRDIDLAVGFEHGTHHDVVDTVNALAGLVPGDHLDVMDLDRAGPVARVEALTRGRILFQGRPGAFTQREIFAVGEYMETAPMRQALLEALAR